MSREIEMLTADGLENALLGQMAVDRWTDQPYEVLVYSVEKILNVLMERDGMTSEEAQEYFDYNIEGAYVGPGTPVYVYPFYEEK
tara:strand:- start:149 stop:403 length:255 start_codon:yes stop_codon:yes gene_type:complete